MSENTEKPDLNFEIGYDLERKRATFSIGISNIFSKAGKVRLGSYFSRWATRRTARSDAKKGLPESDARQPEGKEVAITLKRDQRLTKIKDSVEQLTHDAKDWITQHQPEQELRTSRLRAEIDSILESILSQFRTRLAETRKDYSEAIMHYENFRLEHGLDRPAEVPIFFLRPFVMLLGALLFETIANSFIFSGISTQGMIGGWATAIIVSVINILMGLVLGLLVIRYGRIWDGWPKKLLVTAGVILIVLAVFFNLYVAHFREVAEAAILADTAGVTTLSRDAAPAFADAWPHFLQNPFNLGSILGVGLLVIGLCIFGYAAYEGYRGFTDPYPEYGKVGKRFYTLRLIRIEIEDRARAACHRALNRARQRIERSASLHVHFRDEVTKSVAFANRLSALATNAESRINTNAYQMISIYRSANKRKRVLLSRKAKRKPDKDIEDPGPVPTYFEDDPREANWETTVSEIDDLKHTANASIATISNNLAVIDDARQYVSEKKSSIDISIAVYLDPQDVALRQKGDAVYVIKEAPKRIATQTIGDRPSNA